MPRVYVSKAAKAEQEERLKKEAEEAASAAATPGAEAAEAEGGKKRKLEEVEETKTEEAQKEKKEKKEEKEKKEKKEKKEEKEKAEKKDKKEKKEKTEEGDKEGLSDTEYGEVNLKDSTEHIQVTSSGHAKIDGDYKRMEEPSRGRPAYCKEVEGKKPVYLFWHKTSKWFFSFELGSSKNLARVQDCGIEGRKQPPCEPHAYVWKVMQQDDKNAKDKDSKKKEYVVTPPMRVIDGATLELKSAGGPGAESAGGPEPKKSKKAKKEPKLEAAGPGDQELENASAAPAEEAKASTDASADVAMTAEPTAEASQTPDAEKTEAASAEAAAATQEKDSDSESEDASEKESEKSASASESESSSSDDGEEAPEAAAKPEAAAPAPAAIAVAPPPADSPVGRKAEVKAVVLPEATAEAKAPAAVSDEDRETKREEFVCKLRLQLVSVKDPVQRGAKLQQVSNMLKAKSSYLQQAAGITATDIEDMIEMLHRDFGNKQQPPPAKAKPKPPPGPPPKAPAPAKPVAKSALKRQDKGRPSDQRRCRWPQMNAVRQVQVESFRGMGDILWFQMPGAYVTCDGCEKQVPQSMGALSGEPSKPQFAQFQFICHECMQNMMAAQMMQEPT